MYGISLIQWRMDTSVINFIYFFRQMCSLSNFVGGKSDIGMVRAGGFSSPSSKKKNTGAC